jgi:hypothetical protein
MTTKRTCTKNNTNSVKKRIKNGCGKCGCQLKTQSKPESKFEWIKKFVLKLLHLG